VLQSWLWGELKASQGWQPTRLLWYKEARPVAAAQILIQQRGQLRVGYLPKGPITDWTDLPLVDEILCRLEVFARANQLLLLKMDPDVRSNTIAGEALQTLLQRHAWHPSFEQVQFRNTMILDLHPDLDKLMEQMRSKWRYNLRLAVRKEVVVREVSAAELPQLYQMYAETAQRDNFIIREQAYYLEAWQRFMRAGMALPLLAEVAGEAVAMVVIFYFGARAWYMYGASRDLHRNLMPNHLLQWEVIRQLKARACTTYDLWGAPDKLDENDALWGVYRFKEGLGATFVPHIGAYDYTPRPWLYKLYAFLRPRLIGFAHWRYRAQNNLPDHDA